MPTTIPPTNDEMPSRSVPCPSCGVPVAIGYPRCPKCKAAVPQGARARRGSVREELIAGGTSVADERSSGGGTWMPWVLAALVVVGVGAFFAFRGGGKASGTDTGAKVTDDEEDDTDTDDEDDSDTDDGDDDTTKRRDDLAPIRAGDPMADAAAAFDQDLRDERLWAKVSHDDTTLLRVESSLCPQIEQDLTELASRAYGLGARRVECHTKNGEIVFDRGL